MFFPPFYAMIIAFSCKSQRADRTKSNSCTRSQCVACQAQNGMKTKFAPKIVRKKRCTKRPKSKRFLRGDFVYRARVHCSGWCSARHVQTSRYFGFAVALCFGHKYHELLKRFLCATSCPIPWTLFDETDPIWNTILISEWIAHVRIRVLQLHIMKWLVASI